MKIELTQPHTHAGQALAAGETLDLPDDSARWLIERGVAVESAPEADGKTPSKPRPNKGD